jgi:hypothetical protein
VPLPGAISATRPPRVSMSLSPGTAAIQTATSAISYSGVLTPTKGAYGARRSPAMPAPDRTAATTSSYTCGAAQSPSRIEYTETGNCGAKVIRVMSVAWKWPSEWVR